MIRHFIEVKIFQQLIDQEKVKDLEKNIKEEILKNPKKGDVISGTGGLRKIRVADKNAKKGKSGSYRVIYFDLEKYKTTYLILLFSKSEVENISNMQKKQLKLLVIGLENEYKKKTKN